MNICNLIPPSPCYFIMPAKFYFRYSSSSSPMPETNVNIRPATNKAAASEMYLLKLNLNKIKEIPIVNNAVQSTILSFIQFSLRSFILNFFTASPPTKNTILFHFHKNEKPHIIISLVLHPYIRLFPRLGMKQSQK